MGEHEVDANEMNIQLSSVITNKDYRRAVYFGMFFRSKAIPIIMCIAGILSLVNIALVLAMGFFFRSNIYSISLAYILVLVLTVIVAEMYVHKFKNSDKILLNAVRNFTIDSEKTTMVSEAAKNKGKINHDMLLKACEIKGYFVLYVKAAQVIILPKRDMNSDDINALRELLKQKLPKKFDVRSTE